MSGKHGRAAEIVEAVRGCIGTRFRVQGRVPGLALDCVGVALVAAHAAACEITDVPAYRLGGDHEIMITALLARSGLVLRPSLMPGDLMLCAPAAGRRHLAVATSTGGAGLFVHAHAGLGRVVEAPPDPDWAIIGFWRFPERR
jgi:murein DD-endopeptidase / murein LD-carboxypeptidase